MTNYAELLLELFGTTDEEIIRKKYNKLVEKKKSGRKPLFSDLDIKNIKKLASEGMAINDIAKKYNTSRQIIGKYLNAKVDNTYTVRLMYMFKQYPCTVIDIDYLNKKICISNRTDDIIHRAFGVNENPTWKDYENFLESRVYPKTRADIKNVLEELGVDGYDPLKIIYKTEGRTWEDHQWIKIMNLTERGKNEKNKF